MHNIFVGSNSGAFLVSWVDRIADATMVHLGTEPVIAAATIPGRGVLCAVYNSNEDHGHSRLLWFNPVTHALTVATDTLVPRVTSIGIADGLIRVGTEGHHLYTLDEEVLTRDEEFDAVLRTEQLFDSGYGAAISQITSDPTTGHGIIAVSTGGLWVHRQDNWEIIDHPDFLRADEQDDQLELRCVHGVSVGMHGDMLVQFHLGLKLHDGLVWHNVEKPGHMAGFSTIYRPFSNDYVAIPLVYDEQRSALNGDISFWIVDATTHATTNVPFGPHRDYSCVLRGGLTRSGATIIAGTTSGRVVALDGVRVSELPHHLGRILAVAAVD